ncbi:MAG: GntR family transcriptional regulator [Candidatus Methanomethyliaceae archaeon]
MYEQLRELITNLVLKPGQRISVEDVAHMLEVSATPVREALHRLAEEGFVEQKPYVGFFVVNLTAEDVEELFEIRKSLEALALTRLPFNEQTRTIVSHLLQKLENIKNSAFSYQETQLFDEEFHINFILQGFNGRWITKVAKNVINLIKMSTKMSHNPQAAYFEHHNILTALKENKKKEAVESLLLHLDRAKEEIINCVAKGGDSH